MITAITDFQLRQVQKRLKKQNLLLSVTDQAKKYLAAIGFDQVFGARPLRRAIDDNIIDEIALQIVEGKIKPADEVMVDVKQNKLLFSVKKPN